MPLYDTICAQGHEAERWARWDERDLACETCGGPTERVWKGRRNIISDEWAGGKTFENGFATPQTFYSPSEYRKALAEKGLQVRGDGEESCTWMSPKTLADAKALVTRNAG